MTDATITEPRQLYSVKEFCRRNSIGKTTFFIKLVRSGAIEIVKVGSRTLVPADSERAWLAAIRKSHTQRLPIDARRIRTNGSEPK